MHRLLKAASISRSNAHLYVYVKPCSLCNRGSIPSDRSAPFINNQSRRNLSTEDLKAAFINAVAKKRKPKTKRNYAELVEVSKDKTNVTKAVVKKLSANNVSRLSEESNVSLEQFHQLLNKDKTKSSTVVNTEKFNKEKTNSPTVANVKKFSKAKTNSSTVVGVEKSPEMVTGYEDIFNCINSMPMSENSLENTYDAEAEWDVTHRDTEHMDMLIKEDLDMKHDLDLGEVLSTKLGEKLDYEEEYIEPQITEKGDEFPIEHPEAKKRKKRRTDAKVRIRDDPSVPIVVSDLLKFRKEDLMKPRDLERNSRLNKNLNSYIEMCVQCDLLNLAFGTLSRYVRLHILKVRSTVITGPKAFNILLHGFASKANVDKIQVLLTMMASCKIATSPQTFAACFECFARLPSTPENERKFRLVYDQLECHGFTFDDLMNRCKFARDQRDMVLKSIRTLDPNYTWEYRPPPMDYSVLVLKELNSDHTPFRSPAEKLFTFHQMNELIKEQVNVELKYSLKVDSAIKPETLSTRTQFFRTKWDELVKIWRQELRKGFDKSLSSLETQLINTKLCYSLNIFPYLRVLPPDQYVDVMMNEIYRLLVGSQSYSGALISLHKQLGKRVKLRYDIKFREQTGHVNKVNKAYKAYCQWYLHPELNSSSCNPRQEWQHLINEMAATGPTLDDLSKAWPAQVLQEIGKFLYGIIVENVKINVNHLKKKAQPNLQRAFFSVYRYQSLRLLEEIRPNSYLSKFFKDTQSDDIQFDIDELPMLSPPCPWSSWKSGGYLYTKTEFIRLFSLAQLTPENPNHSLPAHQLYGVFDSLNQLSSIPWKINEPILDIVMKIFREGGSLRLKIPLSTAKFWEVERAKKPKEFSFQETYRLNRQKQEMYSLWTECLYRLSLANFYRKRTFWLPHNLDFRGRVYPVPPHLNHLGADLARSLLVFAKGEKLGPRGLDWLKIHCINLTGLKKRAPMHERLNYANEMLPEMFDSAEKPLTGKMWWIRSDDMWQTLACCMEIKAAIESGDPENYVSHFPVHQDGSCNGLQHYAALGRDAEGGRNVNLTPCDHPQDVYSCVVEKVEEQRVKDAENGKEIAIALEGHIKRKVIKQTVMTTVYGVTMFGARLQIAKQLKASPNIPIHVVWPGSSYLVNSTFNCLRTMFSSTKLIQDWFVDCAKYITSKQNDFVGWETPLGLVALQPYAKLRSLAEIRKTQTGGFILAPHPVKQRNAFPPNYIHSLDSCHMMLTSLQVERKGITFVSVHDCFWTHASTVEIMNQVTREEFVRLHSLPLLEDLSTYFINNYDTSWDQNGQFVFRQIPKKGSLVLDDVLRSTYFFS